MSPPRDIKCKAIDDLHSEIVWGIGSGEACHNKAWESANRLALIADELLSACEAMAKADEWKDLVDVMAACQLAREAIANVKGGGE